MVSCLVSVFVSCLINIFPFTDHASGGFSVRTELLPPVDSSGLKIKVQVINMGKDTLKILEGRTMDYKWEGGIRSLGNYIVHLEKKQDGNYKLFPPTADIDYMPPLKRYIDLLPGGALCDVLYVPGFSFSHPGVRKRSFPPGAYRVKVYFNQDDMGKSFDNASEWIEFLIP